MDTVVVEVDIAPPETVAFVDTQAAIATEEVGCFGVGAFEVAVELICFGGAKGNDLVVLVDLTLGHTNLRVFVHAEGVIGVDVKVVSRIGLSEDEVEHLEEGFDVGIGMLFLVVEIA